MKLNNEGFTLIELLIATTVLSVMLVLISTVSLQIGKSFYKGVTSSRNQNTVREVSGQITRNIQYSAVTPQQYGTPTSGVLCVGSTRYMYQTNVQVSPGTHALWADDLG